MRKHECESSPCSRTCRRPRQSQSTLLSVPWRSWCELWLLSSPQRIGTAPPADCLYTLKTHDQTGYTTVQYIRQINYRRNSPDACKRLCRKKRDYDIRDQKLFRRMIIYMRGSLNEMSIKMMWLIIRYDIMSWDWRVTVSTERISRVTKHLSEHHDHGSGSSFLTMMICLIDIYSAAVA